MTEEVKLTVILEAALVTRLSPAATEQGCRKPCLRPQERPEPTRFQVLLTA